MYAFTVWQMHRNSSSESLCCFLQVHKLVPVKMQSQTHLSWKWYFLRALFSLLTSAEDCSLLQRCTCLPSMVINTMKSVFQRFILLLFFPCLFPCFFLQNMLIKSYCTKLSSLLYFKQFSSSVSAAKIRHFTCRWAFITEYTCTESTVCSNFFLFFLWAETYLRRRSTCYSLSEAHGYYCRYRACVWSQRQMWFVSLGLIWWKHYWWAI